MAYETGTASGPADLITKLISFATANGWTCNNLTITKSGTYYQDGTTGVINVSITNHAFLVDEVLSVDFTSGTAVDGSYPVTFIDTNGAFRFQGAAVDTSGNLTVTSTAGYVFQKAGVYFGVAVIGNDIYICGCTGYSATLQWHRQSGSAPAQQRSNAMAGPYQAYHFFAGTSPDYLHAVVEVTAGVFKHLQIGTLIKSGSYTGGEYACACYWEMTNKFSSSTPNYPDNNYHAVPFDSLAAYSDHKPVVRADIDGKTNNWMQFYQNSAWGGNYARGVIRNNDGILDSMFNRSPSEFNQLTPLLPILVCGDRPSSMVSPLGFAPDIRYVNITNYTPGEVVNIGGTDWIIFPLISKTTTWNNTNSTVPSSGVYGIAYKRS